VPGGRQRLRSLGEQMTKITRREILRRLAGISVLGVVGTAVRATVTRDGHSEAHSFAAQPRGAATKPSPPWTTTSVVGNPSTSIDHAHHAADTTGASTATTGSSTQPTNPATSSPSTTAGTPTPQATTTSAAPQVAVGTSELSGVLGPTMIAAGSLATIVGDVELRGDLVVEGVLTSVDRFTLRGNGFQIEVRNGGQLDLRGIPKSGWVRGIAPNGWQAGDRVLTAPVDPGRFALSDFHTGSPGAVNLADGRTIAAEQFNLTRSITIDNVSRIMFHMGAGRQVLKHIAVTNTGIAGKLGFYPIHFHLNGNTTRGSIVEGVVVENGRNHAFVPHGSHGITFLDCVAFNIIGDAYWWDRPPGRNDTSNDSHDTVWQHCMAAYVVPSDLTRTTGFYLGNGSGNRCVDSIAVGVQGQSQTSGFHWPEKAPGLWEFRACVAHNNVSAGIFTWQNNSDLHVIQDFISYRVGGAGIEHGAYANSYQYRNVVSTDGSWAVRQHAVSDKEGPLVFESIVSNGRLLVDGHKSQEFLPVFYRSCRFIGVTYDEMGNSGSSHNIYENCGLGPADFDLTGIKPTSVIEILQGGSPIHRWAGSWS
jgi:hypothetical protein